MRTAKASPADVLAEVPLDFDARRDAESELSSAILLGSNAQVDLLLRLARRHGIEPDLAAAPMQRRLEEFVGDWIDRGPAYNPDGWARREEVLDSTQEALRAGCETAASPRCGAALERLFRYFADRIGDPSDPLDRHLAAAAIADRPIRERPAQLNAVLDLLLRSPLPGASAAGLQQALVEWAAVGPAEADLLVTRLPGQVEILREVAEAAVAQLTREAEAPSEHTLDILAGLDRHGIRPAPGPLADLLEADREVSAFLEATRANEFTVDQRYFQRTVARLGRAAPAVVRLRLEAVLQACLECRHPYVGGEVLIVLDSGKSRTSQAKPLIDLWKKELGRAGHHPRHHLGRRLPCVPESFRLGGGIRSPTLSASSGTP